MCKREGGENKGETKPVVKRRGCCFRACRNRQICDVWRWGEMERERREGECENARVREESGERRSGATRDTGQGCVGVFVCGREGNEREMGKRKHARGKRKERPAGLDRIVWENQEGNATQGRCIRAYLVLFRAFVVFECSRVWGGGRRDAVWGVRTSERGGEGREAKSRQWERGNKRHQGRRQERKEGVCGTITAYYGEICSILARDIVA